MCPNARRRSSAKCIKKTLFDWILTSFALQGTGLYNINPTEMENPQRVQALGGGGEDL